jgi:membrane-associated protease RseP (regulator of RpoE activity)
MMAAMAGMLLMFLVLGSTVLVYAGTPLWFAIPFTAACEAMALGFGALIHLVRR